MGFENFLQFCDIQFLCNGIGYGAMDEKQWKISRLFQLSRSMGVNAGSVIGIIYDQRERNSSVFPLRKRENKG